MCNRFCGTVSLAKLMLHLSVKHYQVTFERHSRPGLESFMEKQVGDYKISKIKLKEGYA